MISYIIEVSICWAGFYGLYALLLRQTTFFSANRWYLIGTLLLGLSVPLMELPEVVPSASAPVVYYMEPITVGVEQLEVTVIAGAVEGGFNYYLLLRWIYGLGVLLFGSRFLYGLWQIALLYRDATKEKCNGFTLVRTTRPHLPFSFFNCLFWSEGMRLEREDTRSVIRHEQAHIKGGHSIDVLLLEILCVVLWCSPLIYFYRRSVRTVHEYLADEVVLKTTRRKKYGRLLLRQSQSGLQIALANHFFQTQLKQRIMMMTRHKTSRKALIRYLFALPLLILFLLAFANRALIGQTLLEIHKSDGTVLHREVKNIGEADKLLHPDEIATIDVRKDLNKIIVRMKGADEIEKEALRRSNAEEPNAPASDTKTIFHEESGKIYHITEISDPDPDRTFIIAKDGQIRELPPEELEAFNKRVSSDNIERVEVNKEKEGTVLRIYLKEGISLTSDQGKEPTLPRFPGCEDESDVDKRRMCAQKRLLEFIYKNIKYPAAARQAGKQGTVVVQFTIEADGSVGGGKVLRDIGAGAGEEVLRVVDLMPNWVPAQKDGKAVAAEFNLPVQFKLPEQELGLIKAADAVSDDEQETDVYKIVDEMPRFPGCEEAGKTTEEKKACADRKMIEFLYERIKYPKAAKQAKLEGTVVVQFTVYADGSIGDAKIVRNIGGGAGEEALRVVEAMPDSWIPGRHNGKAVAVQFNLPVSFKLGEEDKKPAAPDALQRDLQLSSFSASPNPSSGLLNLRFQAESVPTDLRITDLSGRELLHRPLNNFDGSYEEQIDLSRAAKGTVLLIIQQGERVFTEKILLQ